MRDRATPALYLVGDATMADKPDPAHNPERGWGYSENAVKNTHTTVD